MTDPLDTLLEQTAALRSLARELVGDDLADDVLQEAAIQTMTAPPKRPGPLGGWLAKVVRNQALKQRRASATRARYEREAARIREARPQESRADVLVLRRLTDAVTGLPEPYRTTIFARYLREQTPSEIAVATGTPVATVKTRLQRGLEMLRERLDRSSRDWRGALVVAFALRSPPPLPTPWFATAPMKALILVALLAPLGYGLGFLHDLLGSDAEIAQTVGAEDGTATAATPGPTSSGDPVAAAASNPSAPDDPLTEGRGPSGATPSAAAVDAPIARLEIAGPEAFRRAFAGTRVAELLAAERGPELWGPLQAMVDNFWRNLDGNREEGFEASRRRVLDYAGRIRVLWMIDTRGATEEQARETHRLFGVIALEMDSTTDLSALAGDLSRALRNAAPAPLTTETIGGHAIQQLHPEADGFLTLPMVLGSHAVTFFGQGVPLADAMPRALATLAAQRGKDPAPVAFHVDLARIRELAEGQLEPPLIRALGLECLQSVDVRLRPAGDRVLLEADVGCGAGPRGLTAAFMPPVGHLPLLLSRIPSDATPWLALPFRLDELYRVVADTADALADDFEEPGMEEPGIGLRQTINETIGFDLELELLDHLGSEVLLFGDLWRSDDPAEFREGGAPPLGACLALALRDTASFRAGFDKLLDHFRGVVQRHETRDVDGVSVTRLGTWFLTGTHLAVGQDLTAMAFGPEAVSQLEGLVTGRQDPGVGELSPTSVPDDVRHVQHLSPRGWNGIGMLDLSALFGGQATLALEAFEEAMPRALGPTIDAEALQAWLDAALPLLTEHELTRLVAMTGYDGAPEGPATWRLRIAW